MSERSTGKQSERRTPDSLMRLAADTCPGGLFITPRQEIDPLHKTPVYKEIVPTVQSIKGLRKQLDTSPKPVDASITEDLGAYTERLRWLLALAKQSKELPEETILKIVEDAKHQKIDFSEKQTPDQEPTATADGEKIIFSDEEKLDARLSELNTLTDYRHGQRLAAVVYLNHTLNAFATTVEQPEEVHDLVNAMRYVGRTYTDAEEARTVGIFVGSMQELGLPNDQIVEIWDKYQENAAQRVDRQHLHNPEGEE